MFKMSDQWKITWILRFGRDRWLSRVSCFKAMTTLEVGGQCDFPPLSLRHLTAMG